MFCRITAGIEPATIVAEWPDAVAFEPLNSVAPGHLLVVPHAHVVDATSDPHITGEVFRRAAELAERPCNLITSAGTEATQSVWHFHVHIVPRSAGDRLPLPWTPQWSRRLHEGVTIRVDERGMVVGVYGTEGIAGNAAALLASERWYVDQ